MDKFIEALFAAKQVKATARVKLSDNETRTVSLHTMPADVSEAAFAEAAKQGVDLAVRVKGEDERTRTINGKGVFGAAAVSATCSVLGYTLTTEQERAKGRKNKDGAEPTIL